ncbi:MAG: 3'-5' exonuclease [Candidatus Micrarchaeaceae archaeon]
MIVIDLETSGLDHEEDSILSIGAVDFQNPENQFYGECRLRSGATYNLESLKVNGFSVKDIKDKSKMSLHELITRFLDWTHSIYDVTLAGHNVQFDIKFLERSFGIYNMGWIFGHRNLDTHSLVYAHCLSRKVEMPYRKNKSDITSDFVFSYVGLEKEMRPHNGLVGAKMEAESISRIIYGRALLGEFKKFPVPQYLKRKK